MQGLDLETDTITRFIISEGEKIWISIKSAQHSRMRTSK